MVYGNTNGADARARGAALFSTLAKFAMSLRPDQVDQMLTGAAKLAVVLPGQQVVDAMTGFEQAVKLLRGLSDDERRQLTDKSAKLIVLRAGQVVDEPPDYGQIADEMGGLQSVETVVKHLNANKRLTAPVLIELATFLNISVPPSVKTKPKRQLHIAQQFVGHRRRTLGY